MSAKKTTKEEIKEPTNDPIELEFVPETVEFSKMVPIKSKSKSKKKAEAENE